MTSNDRGAQFQHMVRHRTWQQPASRAPIQTIHSPLPGAMVYVVGLLPQPLGDAKKATGTGTRRSNPKEEPFQEGLPVSHCHSARPHSRSYHRIPSPESRAAFDAEGSVSIAPTVRPTYPAAHRDRSARCMPARPGARRNFPKFAAKLNKPNLWQ